MIDDADEHLRVVADFLRRVHTAHVMGIHFVPKDWDQLNQLPEPVGLSATSTAFPAFTAIFALILGVFLGRGTRGKSQEAYTRLE